MRAKLFLAAAAAGLAAPYPGPAQPVKWVSAYYAGWEQSGRLQPGEIDFAAVTHIIHFALIVNPDGTVSGDGNGITPSNAVSAVGAVHRAGKKILISVGGAYSDASFSGAASPVNRAAFIGTLVQFQIKYGYDGIDIDWEPAQSTAYYLDFIRDLRRAMTAARPASLLVTALMTGTERSLIAAVAPFVDQVNLMTYDMSGAWPGWETWHNSPVYDGGAVFQTTGSPLPSIDKVVRDKLAGGVPAEKLGIGIDFYGYRWSGGDGTSTGGVTGPRQSWRTPPDVKANIPYYDLMETYGGLRHSWDSAAQAAYIAVDNPGSAQDEFISFENERSIRSKAAYAEKMGLGGVIVYELGGGYRRTLPPGYRDLLLQNIRHAFLGGKEPPEDHVPPFVQILVPKDGGVLSGRTPLSARATDNSAVAGVEFSIDGRLAGPAANAPPYAVSVNTWKYKNGRHLLGVSATDVFGNSAKAEETIIVRNEGSMPAVPDRIVYDDSLRAPFVNASWGAVVDIASRAVVRNGSTSARVEYAAWGGFDIQSGPWRAETPVDPGEFDTLRAEIYPLSAMSLKVGYYNNASTEVRLKADEWNSVAVPLNFVKPFTRFYFQSLLDRPANCYFDDIRFTAGITPARGGR